MPLVGFKCPDGFKINLEDCFKGCRFGYRCATLPTLLLISQEREWTGTSSTTQRLNGTMMEYLKLTKPYFVDPDSRAFMLAGTKHHDQLEAKARELGLAAEIPLSMDRDIFDLLEPDDPYYDVHGGGIRNRPGSGWVLTDYKNWGSFKVAKVLGMTKMGYKPDPTGAVYKTSGKWGKAGDRKRVPYFEAIDSNADNFDAEYQLNRYRIMLGEIGVPITRMQVQATVRDGSTSSARSRGLTRNIYCIPVRHIPDADVVAYFDFKGRALDEAMKNGWTQPCTSQECWEGRRCRMCDVAEFCPQGMSAMSAMSDDII